MAPGIPSSTNDDDDWLSLEDEPITVATTEESNFDDDPFAEQGEQARSEFAGDELPACDDLFADNLNSPPPPASSIPAMGVPGSSLPPKKKDTGVPNAPEVEYAKEYRVTCNTCGTYLYAKASQEGKKVKCADCHSFVLIPSPPKVKKKFQVNLDEVESFSFEPNDRIQRGPDPYQQSASQLLEEAAREEEANPTKPENLDVPNVLEWIAGVLSPLKDLGVLAHLLGLIVLAGIPTSIALISDSPILILGLFPGGLVLALLTISCGFAILQSVANDEGSVTDWPTLDPMGWLSQLFLVGAAAAIAAIPIWIACLVILGPHLLSVAITMLSIYLVFPFVLLSMLDMNSVFIPFSSEVARSVTKCEEAWGGFYFSCGLLFVGMFLVFSVATAMTPVSGAMVAISTGVGGTFIYFGMIGRLAFAIGQAVNAPPRHDEIDRSRHTETG